MSSNATVEVSPVGLDTTPEPFQVSIEGAGTILSEFVTTDIDRILGSSPSSATINIPVPNNSRDQINSSWFFAGEEIKIGAFVEVYWADQIQFRGYVVKIHPDKTDGLSIEAQDARWLARGRRIIGAWLIEGYTIFEETGIDFSTARISFDHAKIPTFNPGGIPNCIVFEGRPVFAPHPGFNLDPGDDPSTPLTNKAVYWTLEKIISYVLWAYDSSQSYSGFFLDSLPDEITIPEGITSALDSISQTNFDEGRSQGNQNKGVQRKGREIQANGQDVLGFVQSMLDIAGGNSIYLMPVDGGSELSIVPTWYHTEGLIAYCAASGDMKDITSPAFQVGGIEINGTDLLTDCIVTGQSIKVERRASSKDTPSTEFGLLAAWNPDDETAFLEYLVTGGNFSKINWDEAVSLYPEVGAMYKVQEDYNYAEGTQLDGLGLIEAPRAVLNQQLSFRAAGDIIDYSQANYPLYVETYFRPPGGTFTWTMAHELNGLQLLDTGQIFIPGLRDAQRNWGWKAGFDPANPASDDVAQIEFFKIRMNLAFQSDIRLTAIALNDGMADNSKIAEGFVRSDNVYSRVYRHHIQSDESFPLAETAQGVAAGSTTDIFNDEALAEGHARLSILEQGRLTKPGTLIYRGGILPYHPGIPVTKIQDILSGQEKQIHGVIGNIRLAQSAGEIRTEFTMI